MWLIYFTGITIDSLVSCIAFCVSIVSQVYFFVWRLFVMFVQVPFQHQKILAPSKTSTYAAMAITGRVLTRTASLLSAVGLSIKSFEELIISINEGLIEWKFSFLPINAMLYIVVRSSYASSLLFDNIAYHIRLFTAFINMPKDESVRTFPLISLVRDCTTDGPLQKSCRNLLRWFMGNIVKF